MLLFVIAVVVLAAVGVLLWKAVSAQALATRTGDDEAPTGPTHTPGTTRPGRTSPVAPDDDPEFLRSLDEQVRRGRGDGQEPPSGR